MPSGSVTPAGGAAFNGGTITQELVVDTAAGTGQALELEGTRTSQHDVFRIDYPHQVVTIDSDGVAMFQSNDNMSMSVQGTLDSAATFAVTNAPTLCHATLNADPATGGRVFASDTTGADTIILHGLNGVMIAVHSAPADAAITAGQVYLWFDQTNGAAKLMAKGKTADGTVVAASIALS